MAPLRVVCVGVVLLAVCVVVGQSGRTLSAPVRVVRVPVSVSPSSAPFHLLDDDRAAVADEVAAAAHVPRVRASRASRPRLPVASIVDDAYWWRVSRCESPWNARSRNGLYGGFFQMTQMAWRGGGGEGIPETHSYDEQLVVAKHWAAITNPARQWPVCWRKASYGG